jgi:hypothetical protein
MNAHVEVDAELPGIADAIRRFHKGALDGLKQESVGVAAWRASTLSLGRELLRGRQLHQNDNAAFGAWLKASGLGDDFLDGHNRAALIGMAEHPEIATTVLEATIKRSWRRIWEEEIVPKVEAADGFGRAAKTPSAKREPGRPRQPRYQGERKPAPPPKPEAASAVRVDAEIEALKAAHAKEIKALKAKIAELDKAVWDERALAKQNSALAQLAEAENRRLKRALHPEVVAKPADRLALNGQTKPTEQEVADAALGRGPKVDPGEVAKLEQQLKAARTSIANLTAENSMAWAAAHATPVSIAKTDRRKILAALHPDGSPSKADKIEAFQLFNGLKVHEFDA